MWSVHPKLSLPLFPPQGKDSSLCSCSSAKSLSWETVLYKLPPRESFPWAAALHKLPQHGQGAALQEQTVPAWAPCQQIFSSVGSSRRGSTGPARSLLQHRLSIGSQPPSGIHLIQCGEHRGLQVAICSTVDLHGLQGHSLPHHGLLHELQGNLCSSAWSTSSSSFFTDLGVCRVVSLTYSQSSIALQLPLPLPVTILISNSLCPTLGTKKKCHSLVPDSNKEP